MKIKNCLITTTLPWISTLWSCRMSFCRWSKSWKPKSHISVPEWDKHLHNVLRSSNVVVVGQILFCHQPNFANDCNGLSYDGWLMRPPFFVSGTPFGAPGGPWRGPGGSENLPKQCILLWLPSMPRNGLDKAQSWWNITEHIQGDMLKPFRPL